MIKVFCTPSSPFVRKVLVTAIETGQGDRVDKVGCAAHPVDRDPDVVAANPLGQVPTAILEDGTVLYDSRVICEYLDSLATTKVFPTEPSRRWTALTLQAMGDGLMGAALLRRFENALRPGEFFWKAWDDGQNAKVLSCLDDIEAKSPGFADTISIGTITVACALSYLDFRFPDFDWRSARPKSSAWFRRFSERPSMQATVLR